MHHAFRWAGIAILLDLTGCADEPKIRVASRITTGLGSGQTAPAGTPLPNPVTFIVSDAEGPLSGVTVTFSLGDPSGALAARVQERRPEAVRRRRSAGAPGARGRRHTG